MPNAYLDSYLNWLAQRNQYINQQSGQQFQHNENEANRGLTREQMAQQAKEFQDQFGQHREEFDFTKKQAGIQTNRANLQDVAQGISEQATQNTPGAMPVGDQFFKPITPETRQKREFDLKQTFDDQIKNKMIKQLDDMSELDAATRKKLTIGIRLGDMDVVNKMLPTATQLITEGMLDGDKVKVAKGRKIYELTHETELAMARAQASLAASQAAVANATVRQLDQSDHRESLALLYGVSQHLGKDATKATNTELMKAINDFRSADGKPLSPVAKGLLLQNIQNAKSKIPVLSQFMDFENLGANTAPIQTGPQAPPQAQAPPVQQPPPQPQAASQPPDPTLNVIQQIMQGYAQQGVNKVGAAVNPLKDKFLQYVFGTQEQ